MSYSIINRTSSELKYIAIPINIYGLLLYLLYMPLEKIWQTAFMLGINEPNEIEKKLPNYIVVPYEFSNGKGDVKGYLRICRLRYLFYKNFPELRKARIYGADHVLWNSIIIGSKKMCCIEDGLGLYMNPYIGNFPEHYSFKSKILHRLFHVVMRPFGRGNHCDSILYTNFMTLDIKDKTLIEINPQEQWDKDRKKQSFILDIFNVSNEDIKKFKNKEVILLTQPVSMTEKKKIDLYAKALASFAPNDVIIKRHPRDKTDYRKFFPEIECFTKKIPMELLNFMGCRFKVAVTINSTSIFNFNYDIKKIILDTSLTTNF